MGVIKIQIDYGPLLSGAGLMSPADLDALQAGAAKIEAALVEAQQEEDRRAAELAAAQARIAELEAELAEMTSDRDAWQHLAQQAEAYP